MRFVYFCFLKTHTVGLVSPAQSRVGVWHKMNDPISGHPWWYNELTLAKTWEEPTEWNSQTEQSIQASLITTNMKKVTAETDWKDMYNQSPKIQREYNGWEEHIDNDSGHYWYYNTITYESTWEKPTTFITGEIQEEGQEQYHENYHENYHDSEYQQDPSTPHRLRETTSEIEEEQPMAMSPAYNNLLKDVRSLRESLKIAETELRIMAEESPVKKTKQRPKSANSSGRWKDRSIHKSKHQQRPASAARTRSTHSNQKKSVVNKVDDIEKRIQAANDKMLKMTNQAGYASTTKTTSTRRSFNNDNRSEAAKSAIANAKKVTSSNASNASNISKNSTYHSSYTTIPTVIEEDEEDEEEDNDTPRFDSVHRLCDDALEFASSLKFGAHMKIEEQPSMSPVRLSSTGLLSSSSPASTNTEFHSASSNRYDNITTSNQTGSSIHWKAEAMGTLIIRKD